MGEIVRARLRGQRSVLLIGQAPGADGDVRPLTGTMGLKLAELARIFPPRGYETVPRDEWIGLWFDRANVLDFYPGRDGGKGHAFPTRHARDAAALMFDELDRYDRVLFCGKAVHDAFRFVSSWRDREPWERAPRMLTWIHDTWTTEYAWMPHTSMIVPWWNDPANVEAASVFLRDLYSWTSVRLRSVA